MNVTQFLVTATVLGAELRRVRRARKVSQQALATAAGINLATVKKLEQGRGTVLSFVAALAALGHRFSLQAPDERVGRWIVRERRGRKLSQESLGGLAGVSAPTVYQVERDQGHVNSLAAVMQAMRLPVTLVPEADVAAGSGAPRVCIHVGDCMEMLPLLPERHFHTCITSPPYFNQRDYGVAGQIGLEPSAEEYITRLVEVMRQVHRVLRDDGTLWLVIGDAFARSKAGSGRRRKELLGLPWRVAFALQDDGWLLRQDIILSKSNPLPEPVKDRFVRAHEYLFLLTKSQRYRLDVAAVRERGVSTKSGTPQRDTRQTHGSLSGGNGGLNAAKERMRRELEERGFVTRHKRSVWSVSTQHTRLEHFATFPEALVETCIRAGCPEGGVVLDPFGGSGTVGVVAQRLNRSVELIELNEGYAEAARRRCEHSSSINPDHIGTPRRSVLRPLICPG